MSPRPRARGDRPGPDVLAAKTVVFVASQRKREADSLPALLHPAFQGKNYTDSAPLTVTPRPDSILRIFMAYRPLNAPVSVPPQELTPFVRKGFTLVEWGGQGPDGAIQ